MGKKPKHALHIALNTWLAIALSGILTTLAACQTPATQPKPVAGPFTRANAHLPQYRGQHQHTPQ